MADAPVKKFDGPKKSTGGGKSKGGGFLSGNDDVETIVEILFVLVILGAVLSALLGWFSGNGNVFANSLYEKFRPFFDLAIPIAKIISIGISALCVVGIIYILPKISKIRSEERAILYPAPKSQTEVLKNIKWERISDHINSANPNDWKLAILEADIILNEMLDSMGYQGATMGDKLKVIEKSDFTTIESAWEAHKVRNAIAHESSEFLITEREARRVIGLYEAVFREFNFI